MKLKLIEIKSIHSGLVDLSTKEGLKFDLAYKIARNLNVFEPIMNTFNKCVSDFIKNNGEYDKTSGKYFIPTENKKLVDEINQINEKYLNEVHEFSIQKLSLKDLENVEVPAIYIKKILPLIDG